MRKIGMEYLVRIALIGSVIASSACSHKRVVDLSGQNSSASVPGVATVTIEEFKIAKKKFDYRMAIRNNSDDFMIIMLNDIRCYRGVTEGEAKHTFFNTGERTIDFGPGQAKSFNMVCNLRQKGEGEYKVAVIQVFDNPSHDRKTPGKVIARDIVWTAKGE